MTPPRALVLAAGRGTRLRPVTDLLPKCLVPIGGRTLLDYWLIELASAGVRQIVINTHHLREPVQEYIAAVNRRGGQQITESFEPQLLGSAGTISANRALADGADDVFLLYADNYSGVDLAAMLEFHRSHDAPISMMLFRTPNPRDCGIADVSKDGHVIAFEEKPLRPRGNLAHAGVLIVTADAYREIADMAAFDLGRDVLPHFASRMRGWIFSGWHTDIGSPERYADARGQAAQRNRLKGLDAAGTRPAVFLHRDGVLVDRHAEGSDPAQPRLRRNAAQAVKALRRSGYACIVLAAADVHESFNERMCQEFAADGVVFDAVWRHPVALTRAGTPSEAVIDTAVAAAAAEMRLDLARSWRVGAAGPAPLSGAVTVMQPPLLAADAQGGTADSRAITPFADLGHFVRLLAGSHAAPREASA